MRILSVSLLIGCGVFMFSGAARAAESVPVIPVGYDAYRMWDRWPVHRVGARAYMRSTYDRAGGNEHADASHFLYQERDDFNVTLDVEGAGVLYFVRTNHWHGSPWHYEIDGRDTIVKETSTADPDHPVENSVFLPESAFPNPLTWTWSITKGADLNWVPMSFEKSLRLAYSRTRYGTGYYIFHQFVPGAPLSQPLKGWDAGQEPAREVLDLIARSGTDIAGSEGMTEMNGTVPELKPGEKVTLAEITKGPSTIRAFELCVPRDQATSFSRARLRMTWDGRTSASVETPVALFFGAGSLYNRDNREYLVKAFPTHIRFDGDSVYLRAYFPMPFRESARLELVGPEDQAIRDIQWRCRVQPLSQPFAHVGYFHATYADHPKPEIGQDLVLLDTRDAEGGGDWHGNFIGTSWIFSHNAVLGTLEGDPRFFFDDSKSPQAYGTGTEEWGGGGDYWGGRNMTLPFAGHPTGAPAAKDAHNDEDKIESAYRFLLADLMPFGRRARICLEHGSVNEMMEHYETVTYWYGTPGSILVQTDELNVSDVPDEKKHAYVSPDASAVYEIFSRYELGPDHVNGRQTFPAHPQSGRLTTGTSEFIMKLDPRNVGVMLRRTLDYSFFGQRARIYVADAEASGGSADWKEAGVWYTAGSNTCVFSDPQKEMGEALRIVQTSNRKFRDDEFLLPRKLTEGRDAIRVKVVNEPGRNELVPGYVVSPSAWSELRYTANCYLAPGM